MNVTGLFEWLVHVPEYLSNFGNWLISPIGGGLDFSPLAILGVSAVPALLLIIGLHVFHLFNPAG